MLSSSKVYDYRPKYPPMRLEGSKYWPLQYCDHDVLCPECGGYGSIFALNNRRCHICQGQGSVGLDDPRIKPVEAGLISIKRFLKGF